MLEEIIILSDDEDSEEAGSQKPANSRPSQQCTEQEAKPSSRDVVDYGHEEPVKEARAPVKLTPVDSRQYNRIPRPRFLPIDPTPAAVAARTNTLEKEDVVKDGPTAESTGFASVPFDDEEADPDYEYRRPIKRCKTEAEAQKVPKKHGKLTAADWEVVKTRGYDPHEHPEAGSTQSAGAEEAREYVRKLISGVDWEDMLRHFRRLGSGEGTTPPGDQDEGCSTSKAQNTPSPAVRMKQYWQRVLTKSVMRMNIG